MGWIWTMNSTEHVFSQRHADCSLSYRLTTLTDRRHVAVTRTQETSGAELIEVSLVFDEYGSFSKWLYAEHRRMSLPYLLNQVDACFKQLIDDRPSRVGLLA